MHINSALQNDMRVLELINLYSGRANTERENKAKAEEVIDDPEQSSFYIHSKD